jgi:Domain of unknown function (DUF4157)
MTLDRSPHRTKAENANEGESGQAPAPAKRTASEASPVQLRASARAGGTGDAGEGQRAGDWVMNDGLSSALGLSSGAAGGGDVNEIASRGVAGASAPLPHLDAVQRSFGNHDVSGVRAEVGGAAQEASRSLGAEAYATGGSVAFASAPDLHTAAHEAAHVVQQREGVQLKGGMGEAGDRYEQHADAVADAVVAGRSAEPLLNEMAPSAAAGSTSTAVQRRPMQQLGGSSGPSIYVDHRGTAAMHLVSENVYEIGGKRHTHYPETDQYQNNETAQYWDPATGAQLTLVAGESGYWYTPDGFTYYAYVDGQYQLYQPEATTHQETSGFDSSHWQTGGSFSGGAQEQETEQVQDPAQQLESMEVALMTAEALIEESCTSKALTAMFIQSASMDRPMSALTLFRSWNQAYAQVGELMKAKEATSGATKPTNKRKAGQSGSGGAKAVFAPLQWSECQLTAEEMLRKLESDQRREQAQEHREKKTKKTFLSKLEYNGEAYDVALLSDGGGYYDVYNITDSRPIVPGRSNADLVLRIPKTGPEPELAGQGMRSHGQLASKRVPVPQVLNRPARDGFFLVEKIAHELDPRTMMNKPSFAALEPHEQQRLEQIRGILENNARAERPEVPDFRPSNLRFRDPQSTEVVLVDFTDEAQLGQTRGEDFWRDMKGVLLEFCERRESHWIYQYLIANFSPQHKLALERANEF